MQEDIGTLRKHLEKLYRSKIEKPGVSRQEEFEKQLLEISSQQQSLKSRQISLQNQLKNSEKSKNNADLRTQSENLAREKQALEDSKIDSQILQKQHKLYLENERERHI